MSTFKIFLAVTFIFLLLMSSVFLMHLKKNDIPKTFSNDYVTLFPIPREVKEFALMRTDDHPFNQNAFLGHWSLLFFGFTHCQSICPTTLDLLNHCYQRLKNHYSSLQVVFVSLDPSRDTRQKLQSYTATFNPDFIGVSGKIQQLRKLQSQFGIYSEKEQKDTNYQILHSPTIIFIDPKGKWVGSFNSNAKVDDFVAAFKAAELSYNLLKSA